MSKKTDLQMDIGTLSILVICLVCAIAQSYYNDKEQLILKKIIHPDAHIHNLNILDWIIHSMQYDTDRINSLSEIYAQLQRLSKSPFGHVKLQNLTVKESLARIPAVTTQGNYIPYMNLSIGSYIQKPTIVVVGGVHGCEWLGVAAVMHLIQEFTVNYFKHGDVIEKITWIAVPVLNPDGYNATLSDKKMKNWCKNMYKPNRTFPDKKCFGVDLALNFEYQWLNYDFENSTFCDEHYADKPFTQNESRALRDTIRDHLGSVKVYVTILQNKRAFTYPYSYTKKKPLFADILEGIVQAAASAASSAHHRHFDFGHVLQFANESAGNIDDWIKAHFDVELAFSCFISDRINNNKPLHATEVQWTNHEVLAALKVIASKGVGFDSSHYLPGGLASSASVINTTVLFYLFGLFCIRINN